ncbi:MAG: peptidoglycan-binding domain-containing protein [Eubacteriales bacterium]|nr:peptidoglycan-binding domain-containing protein [Eubacteriales bacterium]
MAGKKKIADPVAEEPTKTSAAKETEEALVSDAKTEETQAPAEAREADDITESVKPEVEAESEAETEPEEEPAQYTFNRTLKYGATGEDVKALQKALIAAGCDVTASGTFDMRTVRAVQKQQRAHQLPANGIVGKHEYPKLLNT